VEKGVLACVNHARRMYVLGDPRDDRKFYPWGISTLAATLFHSEGPDDESLRWRDVTEAEYRTVLRAVRSLRRKGLVETRTVYYFGNAERGKSYGIEVSKCSDKASDGTLTQWQDRAKRVEVPS